MPRKNIYIGIQFEEPKLCNNTMSLPAVPVLPYMKFKEHVDILIDAFKMQYDRDQIKENNIKIWNYIKYDDKYSTVIMYIPVGFTDTFAISNNIRMCKNKVKVILYNPKKIYWLNTTIVIILIIAGITLGSVISVITYPF